MFTRRSAVAASLMVASVFSIGLLAQKDKKQDENQKKEIQAIVKLVDDASASGQLPNDLGLAWAREDFLKAQGNKEYVPFMVSIDPSKVGGGTVALYWRVVAKAGAPTATPAATGTNGKKDDKDSKKSAFAYEDISFVPVAPSTASPMRVARSFTVPAGDYDVFVVAKEPTPQQKGAPAPKTSILKQSLTVPDFWNGELSTSTVIIAQKIDQLTTPLTPAQQADHPYALGSMEISPAVDMKFSKKQELSTFMLIYNAKNDEQTKKPDVQVEYNFYAKPKDGPEKFFNKTNPQTLNAQTLPPAFDPAQGHQLQSGQAVPLATFPEGDYRLEIKVTDKIANKSLTRDVSFAVVGS